MSARDTGDKLATQSEEERVGAGMQNCTGGRQGAKAARESWQHRLAQTFTQIVVQQHYEKLGQPS